MSWAAACGLGAAWGLQASGEAPPVLWLLVLLRSGGWGWSVTAGCKAEPGMLHSP